MEYIAFMHNNVETDTTGEDWDQYLSFVRDSGKFRGGSAIGNRSTLGEKSVPDVTEHIGGYMRFDCDSLDELKKLLERHPVYVHGGTIEICEMPKT